MLPPISDGICGTGSPLRITALNLGGRAVELPNAVTTNCVMAEMLVDWAAEVDAYALSALDASLERIEIGTSMMCRNRNGADGDFVSEHGFANAIDVTSLTFSDGRTIGVEADWMPSSSAAGKLLRQAHGAACSRFTTVLGPEANAEHEDHFHFDLGCHGKTCQARICE